MCSLAGNLRVTQLVDGNKGIHMLLPKSLPYSLYQKNFYMTAIASDTIRRFG